MPCVWSFTCSPLLLVASLSVALSQIQAGILGAPPEPKSAWPVGTSPASHQAKLALPTQHVTSTCELKGCAVIRWCLRADGWRIQRETGGAEGVAHPSPKACIKSAKRTKKRRADPEKGQNSQCIFGACPQKSPARRPAHGRQAIKPSRRV